MVKAFGIFEGGGAKGLAHVGALKAAEENGVEFVGLAGSSAGAIVAALVAVGYKADELFDPDHPNDAQIFDQNFVHLLGRIRWNSFTVLLWFLNPTIFKNHHTLRKLYTLLQIIACFVVALIVLYLVAKLWLFGIGLWESSPFWTGILILAIFLVAFGINHIIPLGVFSTGLFEGWLNKQLQHKLFPEDPTKIVTFDDIDLPLKIIVTDLRSRRPIAFSKDNHAHYSVATVVRSSISIPAIFPPYIDDDLTLVDGGVLSNFPAWVFDKERRQSKGVVSTIGFRLHPVIVPTMKKRPRRSLSRFVVDLSTVFFGDNFLQTREIDDLYLIPIKTSAHTLDFNMDRVAKRHLYHEGFVSAMNFFRKDFTGPRNAMEIAYFLENLHKDLISIINTPNPHLRLNIAVPREPRRETLRILYPHNMDEDADDNLELEIDAGAVGKVWEVRTPLIVDMREAEYTYGERWKLTKYQQALVRRDLKTLLSIPVFAGALNRIFGTASDEILGVLTIDSDDDLFEDFAQISNPKSDLTACIVAASNRISRELRG